MSCFLLVHSHFTKTGRFLVSRRGAYLVAASSFLPPFTAAFFMFNLNMAFIAVSTKGSVIAGGTRPWLPDGDSQILRLYVFGPSGLKDYGSAMLRCKM